VSTIRETGLKVYLVNDTSLNLNWGSRATTYKLKEMLARVGANVSASLPLHQLTHMTWEARVTTARFSTPLRAPKPEPFNKLANVFLNRSAGLLPEVVPPTWQDFDTFAKRVLQGTILPDVKTNLSACDLVFINGEGGIFGNQRESRMMLFVAYLAKKYFNKPVVLASHSAEIQHSVLHDIARNVYPLLDDVVFREAQSQALCQPFVAGKLSADVTFDYTPAPYQAWAQVASQPGYFHTFPDLAGEFDPRKPYVCVGGSSSYFRKDRPNYNPVSSFMTLCENLQHEVGQVVLTASAAADLPIFEPIAKRLNLPLLRPELSPQQAVDVLGHSSCYIGGRWHGAIFAATGGTPVITLAAHTFKNNALNKQLDLPQNPFDPFHLEQDREAILTLLKQQLSTHSRLDLRNRSRRLGRLSWENVRFVREQVRQSQNQEPEKMSARA
jgi:polysaccharide pyruvyl transferase WcaK-like protein